MGRFEHRIALVTGASSGVGRATAIRLAEEGAAVALVGRDAERLGDVEAEVGRSGGRALAIIANAASNADVESAVAHTVDQLGGLDLLANVAGSWCPGRVTELSEDDWDRAFDTNTKACFLTAKHAIPAMRARGGGAIVNVSSVYAQAADPGSPAYSASKAAVVALTRVMALDHVADGIRVNCVAPGGMDTPMLHEIAKAREPEDPESVLAAAGRLHPIGRLVVAAEVASLVCFLLSDEAAAMVGTCCVIDGGRLAKLGTAS